MVLDFFRPNISISGLALGILSVALMSKALLISKKRGEKKRIKRGKGIFMQKEDDIPKSKVTWNS